MPYSTDRFKQSEKGRNQTGRKDGGRHELTAAKGRRRFRQKRGRKGQ